MSVGAADDQKHGETGWSVGGLRWERDSFKNIAFKMT